MWFQYKTSFSLIVHEKSLTAEINAYKRIAGEAIFEIGRRLKHVKENDLVHGQWERWCRDEASIPSTTARKLIAVYEELGGSNRSTSNTLGLDALYLVATLPHDERERPHTVPSSGEVKRPDEMTVRELREVYFSKSVRKGPVRTINNVEHRKQASKSSRLR